MPDFRRTDSAQVRQRDRTCFSSSCALRLETLNPGTLNGAYRHAPGKGWAVVVDGVG